ncbi:hypothetical protein HDU84_005494 [Entophlyctis sp. JEL0112]|nr:hypothetical protein HDU84_005494 [Entophlyctis sp. JEL0112]
MLLDTDTPGMPAPALATRPAPDPAAGPGPEAEADAAHGQILAEAPFFPVPTPVRSNSSNPLESMFDNDNAAENTNGNNTYAFAVKKTSLDQGAGADDDDDEKEEERLRALRNSSATAAPAADLHKESDLKSADAAKSSAKKQTPRSSHYSIAPAAADVKYTPGMIVWAKVKGYPWWPGRIEHEHELPANILKIKPTKMITPHSPIYFCGTRDYGWQPHDLLRPFAEFREELTERGNRTAAFLLAVREGNNPHLLNTLPDNAAVAVATSASAGSSKKQTKKRRDDDYDGVDDIAGDDEDGRKRRKSSAGGEKRGRKKASSAAAPSAAAPADANGVDALDKAASSPSKADKKDELKTPEEKLKRLRSKLQNFLLKDHTETDHFSRADRYLTEVEQFAVDVALLLSTKIGKVIRRISEMTIPDDKYNIVERSRVVVEKWKLIVDS